MKIVFLYPVTQDALNFMKEELPKDIKIIARIRGETFHTPLNEDPEIINETKDTDILMGPYITDDILSQAIPKNGGKLKLVIIPWTGVDRLNFDLVKKYSVVVANSHGNARTVAEHAIALLLTASKNIIHHDRLMREGDWSSRFVKMPSIKLQGKTVGLFGYGAIGIECAILLKSFGVKFIGCRRNPAKSTEKQKELAEKIYSKDELEQFLQESDIIINSLPLTRDTRDILGEKEFAKMKDGVIIINVGRGHTINEKAFYDALKSGKVFAAGIDPQWNYPSRTAVPRRDDGGADSIEKTYPSEYPIHEFDNVVLSPHRAAHIAVGYERGHWDDVIENIKRIYEGKEPINVVDIEEEY
jgi:phosphoglycerate dehydrogenase-like enzyme